jgi:hypothetical protein
VLLVRKAQPELLVLQVHKAHKVQLALQVLMEKRF